MTIEESLKLLNINEKPTKTAIKKAFRQAATKYHPDKQGSSEEFIKIKVAYDTLMATSTDKLTQYKVYSADNQEKYDPFMDLDYDSREFFEPESPATEGFERKLRAKGCKHCGEFGFVTKNVDPSKGFLGRERRLCKCQWK